MKFRLLAAIAAAGIAAAAALPARAQSVIGYLDIVDQQSVLGWSCFPGNPNTKVNIELWAWDNALGAWAYIGTAPADKQRIDVSRAGVCGSGLESNYHGFEWPVYPDNILVRNKNYSVYAYYRPTGQFLGNSPKPLSFPDGGLPTSGFWRTDYDDPNNRSPALLSCIWPYLGANSRALDAVDLNWINAGPTWPGGLPQLGYATTPGNNNRCINYDVSSGGPGWAQSNSKTNAPSWPTSNYWVVSANYEPAYSLQNSGPPNQSQPINAGGVYSVGAGINTAGAQFLTLTVDNQRKPRRADGTVFDGIPYLSFGAQMGRGSPGPLTILDPATGETYLQFSVAKNIDVIATRQYHFVGVFIEAMWGGKKRMVTVALQQQDTTQVRAHWNWNAYSSFFYPGAEIDFVSLDDLAARCGIFAGEKLDGLPGGGFGRSYSIPLNAVFNCAQNGAVPNLSWSSPRPAGPVFISGVHFALETPDGDTSNVMQMTFSGMRFAK